MKPNHAVLLWQKLLLLTVMTVSSFSEHSVENAYHITPTPDTPCPGDPCLTLSQYVEQYYWNNLTSNITLMFLPGEHTLNVTISMGTIPNYTAQLNQTPMKYLYYPHPSLTLLGSPSSLPEVTSKIVCTWPAGFIFSDIPELHISSLAFVSCGHNDSAAVNILSVLNINISSCTFQNNTNGLNSSGEYGGGINVYNSTLTLIGNTFMNNFAQLGGALYIHTNNTVILTKNTFQNNSADDGGALLVGTNNTLTLSENTFRNNFADYGGALLVGTNNTLTLSENTFRNNSAVYEGGAVVAIMKNTLSFSVNTFHNNFADLGGALFVDINNTLTLSENTFGNNSADSGGAVLATTKNTFTFSKNTFQNNSADIAAGAFGTVTNNTLTFSENTFQNNSAVQGGAIFAETNNVLTLSGNVFQNNSAEYGGALYAVHGGAIYAETNNILTLSGNVFQNNSAEDGGALYAQENNSLTFSANKFQSNTADSAGGAVVAHTKNTLTFSINTFQNNSAGFNGGAFHAQTDNNITLSENIFQYNSAAYAGGVVLATRNNNLTLSKNTFYSNTAERGGALYAFLSNTLRILSENKFEKNSALIGGAILTHTNNTLTLSQNKFHSNSADYAGGALHSFINNIIMLSVNIFKNNSAEYGGAIYAHLKSFLNLSYNTLNYNSAVFGGALVVRQSMMNLTNNDLTRNTARSYGGAIFCFSNSTLEISGSHKLKYNIAQYGGGIAALECQIILDGDLLIANNNASFGGGLYVDRSQVSGHATFTSNHANADGGAVYSSGSRLYFKQHVSFIGNAALNGGGLLFTESSQLHLLPNTTINFTNNFVGKKGGAIKVEKSNPLSYCANIPCQFLIKNGCFFQIETERQYDIETTLFEVTELRHVRIYFKNNTALEAGADLYGSSFDHCSLNFINQTLSSNNFFPAYWCPKSGEVFNHITRPDEQFLDISSDPLYICTCEDGEPDCSVSSITRSVYPGGRIEVPIIAYGQRNGTTPAVIHSTSGSKIEVDEPENTQSIKNTCTPLSYTVRTRAVRTTQEMTLYVEDPCPLRERILSSLPTNTIKVRVHIHECPPGFGLLQFQPVCKCAQRIQRFTNTCNIDDGKIERSGEFWVGYVPNSTSDGLILHPHCPFDYCKTPKTIYVAVDDSDEQCSNNRTGLLCGECGEYFSLALGTNRCLQCSNGYLWLIVAFAFAGVALVLLLLALRLTVAVGTINGLVFYANMNSATFFRPQNTNALTVFIAWLNLDLGIETCFYNGMDAHTKAWLQFVFPVYVWTLVGIIILISHYSSKVATILGTNPIAVLATLFLLSYTKFLRAIITSLSYTLLEYPNNSQIAAWLYDGNISYLSNKHIPLFTVALVCLIVLFLPYTIFLIFSQWLRSKSGQWRIFHWVNHYRVLPFLDAYHAPYTDKHRYWTGLMLLVRCILFLLFAFNALGDPSVNLLAIGSVTAGLMLVYAIFGNRIYKTWYLNVLELSFIANLSILALATLYVRSTGGNQNAVTFTSISVAFATFIGIVTYHSAQQIKHAPKLWRKLFPQNDIFELVPQIDEDFEGASPPSPPDPSDGATVTHINLRELLDLNELREPCMETDVL